MKFISRKTLSQNFIWIFSKKKLKIRLNFFLFILKPNLLELFCSKLIFLIKCQIWVNNFSLHFNILRVLTIVLFLFRETKVVSTPEKEKKVVEEEKPVTKVVEEADEDSKTSENGEATETKENGSTEEKEVDEKEEEETPKNGDSTGKF